MTSKRRNPQSPAGDFTPEGLDRPVLTNPRVVEAFSRVPRHRFVPEAHHESAYSDRALPIGAGQTISQPFIVALMTQEAQVGPQSKVLEIGTGSGYQSALLAEMGAEVFTIEIVSELAERAKLILGELGYKKIHFRQGDGWAGWKEESPFDAILVTAAAPRPPADLVKQLVDGGRLVVPVERPDEEGEVLLVLERRGDEILTTDLGAVKFVPITGSAREKRKTYTNGAGTGH